MWLLSIVKVLSPSGPGSRAIHIWENAPLVLALWLNASSVVRYTLKLFSP